MHVRIKIIEQNLITALLITCATLTAMTSELQPLTARWIWRAAHEKEDDYNRWILARRTFDLAELPQTAYLRATADTRYQLFINGHFVVDGPVKAHPEEYRYDQLEVARFLKKGVNVIAVRVHHWGRDTAQSIAIRPGLLVQLEWQDSEEKHRIIATDNDWRVINDHSNERSSPQVSAHLGFEEQFDARLEPIGWMNAEFNDSQWERADAFAGVDDSPWLNLRWSNIPPLAKSFHSAIAVLHTRSVRTPHVAVAINVGREQSIARKADNRNRHRFVLAGILNSDRDQDAVLLRPSAGFIFGKITIGENTVNVKDDLLTQERHAIKLRKGENPVIIALDGMSEIEEHQFVIDAEDTVTLRAAFGEGHWSLAGPFPLKSAEWPRISSATSLTALEPFRSSFRNLKKHEIIGTDVHALTSHRIDLGDAAVQNPVALTIDNEEDTIIPSGDTSVELMIDLGKEYNAHIEFEVCAAEGTIIDGNIFERFHEGAPQWSWRNRSSFRYVTRNGWQRYRTMRHFGGRYLALTVRERTADVRLRRVAAVATHYPVSDRGMFFSSDALLNNIWSVCRQTMLSCMEDTFVDCPLYEQSYWLGDARNEALVCYFMFGNEALVRRCCDLGGESLARGDLAAMRVPTRWPRVIPAWSFLWLRMCWEHYQYTGDQLTLRNQNYPRIRKMLDTCLDKYIDEKTGLFSIQAWQFFDWVNGLDTGHKIVLHNNTFLVDSLRLGANMAELSGDKDVAERYRAKAEELTILINQHFWDEDRGAYIDSIHNNGQRSHAVARPFNTLALLHGVVPQERRERVMSIALGERTEGVTPFGSPFATLYLLELLGETGHADKMLDIIRELWGGMLDSQTTTFWESFPVGNLGGGRYPTRSYCHAWSAGPAYVFSRYVLGARIDEPGGRRVTITPRVDLLKSAEGTVPLYSGEIKLYWQSTAEDEVTFSVENTQGITVALEPPQGWKIDNASDKTVELPSATRRTFNIIK